MTALAQACRTAGSTLCRLLLPAKGRRGRRAPLRLPVRHSEPLAAWPLADPDIHRPEPIPFTLDPHPYTETR